MALAKIKHDVELRVMECGTCGVAFAMPQTYYNHCYEDGGFWHCPLGHSRGWNEGQRARNEKDLKNKLAQAQAERDSAIKRKEWAEQEAKNQKQEAAALKSKLTKMTNRAKAGTCPCCNRTFKQLAAHMQNKHPEFKEAL